MTKPLVCQMYFIYLNFIDQTSQIIFKKNHLINIWHIIQSAKKIDYTQLLYVNFTNKFYVNYFHNLNDIKYNKNLTNRNQ